MLYFSLFYPHLTYGILFCGSTYQSHLNSTITSQKKVVRVLYNADRLAHTNSLFYNLKILTFEDLYKLYQQSHV